MIEGVVVKDLKVIPDERGFLFEILRSDEAMFETFGQVYITAAYPGVIKAWHHHRLQADHWCTLVGEAKIVLYDMREGSPTYGKFMEIYSGEQVRRLVKIPIGVAHGYKNIGTTVVQILNIPTMPYNAGEPDEFRIDPHSGEIPYDWNRRDG